MVDNHMYKPFPPWEEEMIAHIPPGGNWKMIPYNALPKRLKKIRDNMRHYHAPAFYQRAA